MIRKRPLQAAVLLAGILVTVGTIASTAWAGTGAWQDIWAQIRPILSDSGTINQPDNPVHWTKLKGVPTGLADGLDNGVDKAGFGLKRNVYPQLEFAVDPTKIQRRIDGACPEGQAVQSIGATGSVACVPAAGGVVVYHGSKDPAELQPVGNDWSSIGPGTLRIPAGAWSIAATVSLYGSYDISWAHCRLEAWVDGSSQSLVLHEEQVVVGAPDGFGEVVARVSLPLSGIRESSAPSLIAVVCRDSWSGTAEDETNVKWGSVRITALRVNELHVEQIRY
jgi:hypothetical protein